MAAPVITISFDVSEESVGSVVLRVILFGTIPTKIPIIPDIPTHLPTTLELPTVSPFLCSDDSKSDLADELPERYVSLVNFSAMGSKWRAKVISRLSSPSGLSLPNTTIPSAKIPLNPIPPSPSTEIATTPPACDTLTPVITASPVIRSPALSPEASLPNTSSSSSSDSTSYALESSFTTSLQDYATPTSSSSAGPSQKKSQSLATSILSTVHTAGALSPAQANLLPPHKRYRGTSAAHSYESGDESSPETHAESDMDSDIPADIEAEITAAATIAAVTIDGLGIEPVMAGVEMGFEPGLAVVESESKPKEVEADDEDDVEIQPKGTIEIGVDITTGIDIPHDLPMSDIIERLEQLEESVQGQIDQQARNLIVDDERSILLERVAALECSNMRLQDALGIERVRADSLQPNHVVLMLFELGS
ncbi:hypothetical protein Tco_0778021 [Tanacetum coccineum]